MSYIKHQAKLLHLNSENITIASEHITTMSEILEDVKVSQIEVVDEDSTECSQSHMTERVDSFIHTHLRTSVICFTDGATSEVEGGFGSASVVLLPLESEAGEIIAGEIIPKRTDSIEAELTAIALALKQAILYYQSTSLKRSWSILSSLQTVERP